MAAVSAGKKRGYPLRRGLINDLGLNAAPGLYFEGFTTARQGPAQPSGQKGKRPSPPSK